MKNYFFVLFMLLVLGVSVNAQVLLEENFNYTDGAALTSNNWTISGTSVVNPISVISGGLSYTGYPSSGGSGVALANNGQDVYRIFNPISSGSVYLSFLANWTTALTGDYFIALSASTSQTNYYARLHAKASGAGFSLGISKNNETSGGNTYGASVLNFNQTYLVVVKYLFNPSDTTNDAISVFVFTDPTLPNVEPGTPEVGPYVTALKTDVSDIGMVTLRQGSSSAAPTLVIDGIRIATSWADAGLPVELTSFSANSVNGNVELIWKTATEKNNNGFDVERKSANSDFVKIGFVKGNGTTTNLSSYSFTDKNTNAKSSYSYRLKQVDFDGTFTYSNIVNVSASSLPTSFSLTQNFPNPFNPSTSISYSVPQSGVVTLAIFNTLGQKVKEVVNQFQEAGNYTVSLNASDLSSGNYIYNINLNGQSINKKMLLLK